jgi:hypothetical protein
LGGLPEFEHDTQTTNNDRLRHAGCHYSEIYSEKIADSCNALSRRI